MIFAGLGARLAPYKLALQFGLLAVLVLLGFRAGCSWQAGHDAKAMARKDAALLHAAADLEAAGRALRSVSANTAAEVAKAAQRMADAKEQAEAAKRDAKDFLTRLVGVERELEEAKRQSPDCRRLLESKTCASLH